jgi:hypothetical protein
MTRTLTKLALAAALALGVAGCVYEPAPYYAAPAPAPAPYYGYYGPAYAGPSVSLNYRSGGGWYRPHGRD